MADVVVLVHGGILLGSPKDQQAGDSEQAYRMLDMPPASENAGPQTRSRYKYQDECAALLALGWIESTDFLGLVTEYGTDIIFLWSSRPPLFVAVKHREATSQQNPSWTWSALVKQNVLKHLHLEWRRSGERASLAFATNAGFSGPAEVLHAQLNVRNRKTLEDGLIKKVAALLKIDMAEAGRFLQVLRLSDEPLPRRKEIAHVGAQTLASLLVAQGQTPGAVAVRTGFAALAARIALASEDAPSSADVSFDWSQLEAITDTAAASIFESRFISRAALRGVVAKALEGKQYFVPSSSFVGDPLFVGRISELNIVLNYLKLEELGQVAPVLVCGPPGAGKTSFAAEIAARVESVRQPIWISGDDHELLVAKLRELSRSLATEAGANVADFTSSSDWLKALFSNSKHLLIIDDVHDLTKLRDLIPAATNLRILVTSRSRAFHSSSPLMTLERWERTESIEYARHILVEEDSSLSELAARLGDNPLAIVQACNYCKTFQVSINSYLELLQSTPRSALSHGIAGAYPDSAWEAASISVNRIDNEHASDLLRLLSVLGASAIPSRLLSLAGGIAFAADEHPITIQWTEKRARRGLPWWPKTEVQEEVVAVSPFAMQTKLWLAKPALINSALNYLIETSLVSRVSDNLLVHPLVRMAVLSEIKDKRPWLELAFGLLLEDLRDGYSLSLDAEILSIASALCTLSWENNLNGVATIAFGNAIVGRLQDAGLARDAASWSERVLLSAQSRGPEDPLSRNLITRSKMTHASQLINLDGRHEAVDLFVEVAQTAGLAQDPRGTRQVILDLGHAAMFYNDRKAARDAWTMISTFEVDESDIYLVRLRAHLKEFFSEGAGRVEIHELALRGIHDDDVPFKVRAELLADVADLDPKLYSISDFVAAVSRCVQGFREQGDKTRAALTLQRSADILLDRNAYKEAQIFIERAWNIVREWDSTSAPRAQVMAVRGRLRFATKDYAKARKDLESALSVLRETGRVAELPAVLIHLGQAVAHLGYYEEGLNMVEEARRIDIDRLGESHSEVALDEQILHAMKVARMLGDFPDASK